MSWFPDYKQDIRKYVALNGGSALKNVLTQQGLWATLQYRIDRAVYSSTLPGFLKKPVRLILVVCQKLVEITTGISLPCTASIGPGLHVPHAGNIVVHGDATIGAQCCLSQGVTIGVSGRGEHRGVPVIGNRVYVGVNAVVVGKIVVGDESVIGANSLVNRDVPPHSTVLGVPATVVSDRGSEDYL